jgi:UDP-glucuronate 4-epimerase
MYNNKTILVTGSVGFIGSALSLSLLESGSNVIGLDNHNDYYDIKLKEKRLERNQKYKKYVHLKKDLKNRVDIENIFENYKPDIVVNLAAQAGVRYSIINPFSYIDSNIVGFANILECCRNYGVEHLVYASSSSVYGANTSIPFSVSDNVDHPLNMYAVTKKTNELMAHTYSHLYNLPTTGLRFFTVYGPWDRPDMALQKFAKSIMKNEKIKIFNNGDHSRDFTYIDDIIEGISRVIDKPAQPDPTWSGKNPNPSTSSAPWRIYNIGSNRPVNLMNYIELLEKSLGKKANKEYLGIQPGDIPDTWANIDDFVKKFDYTPRTTVEKGIQNFSNWFLNYYNYS